MTEVSPVIRDAAPSIWADTPVILRAEGLKKAFGGQIVLAGVNVELKRGEVVLLRGENGSGKTTLLNILTGNLEPDGGAIHYLADGTPRSYIFPRKWWQELNPFDHFVPEFVAREGMGRTWQDVRLFGSQNLRDNISVAEPGHPGENPLMALVFSKKSALIEKKLRDQADAALSRFGLAGREESSADKISLGQSKRVAIARAVAAGAKILFLDEPLAGLDRQGIADVIGLLESLVRERTLTLVIVEHVFNQFHLKGLVSTDWLLADGKLFRNTAKTCSSSLIQDSGLTQITQGRKRGPLSEAVRPPWFDLLAGENAEIIDEQLSRGALLTRIRHFECVKDCVSPVLEIRDLIVKRGPRTVIGLDEHGAETGFNLSLYDGEIAILQAPNGWGKSTLVGAMCGFFLTDSGTISLKGESINHLSTWRRVSSGLRVLPSARNSFPSLRAGDALKLAGSKSTSREIDHFATRHCSSLSGGERQRVAFNCTLNSSKEGTQFILDEPFAAYDRTACEEAVIAIRNLRGHSVLILIPTAQQVNP